MRQTLLGWKLVNNKDCKCSNYYTVHVIPKENNELLQKVTSPNLKGRNISEAWKSTLKEPDKYLTISPKDFLSPCSKIVGSKSLLSYLDKRYW